MAKRVAREGSSFCFIGRVHLYCPSRLVANVGHTDLPTSSVCCLHPCKSEHRWSKLRCSPLRLTTAAGAGSRDCALRFHSASSTTPPRRFGCRSVPPRHLRSVTARGASLHLRLQTIFTLPFPLYPRHLRLCLRCRVRSHSSVPRNLRLLFRPVRTGIRTPSSNRRTAAIRHHPPTHKRTDERTEISPWHSLVSRPVGQYGFDAEGRYVGGFRYRPHPERGLCNGI